MSIIATILGAISSFLGITERLGRSARYLWRRVRGRGHNGTTIPAPPASTGARSDFDLWHDSVQQYIDWSPLDPEERAFLVGPAGPLPTTLPITRAEYEERKASFDQAVGRLPRDLAAQMRKSLDHDLELSQRIRQRLGLSKEKLDTLFANWDCFDAQRLAYLFGGMRSSAIPTRAQLIADDKREFAEHAQPGLDELNKYLIVPIEPYWPSE